MDEDLHYEPKSAWERYDENDLKEMRLFVQRYVDFLSACKTEREVIAYCEERLRAAGFGRDPEDGDFVRAFRNKALFAARKGSAPLKDGLLLIASHGDSPRLDFKQRPLLEQADVVQGQTHYYGGIRKYQWLARPLALHGVAFCQGKKIGISLGEDKDDPVFTIADLLPHLAQKQVEQNVREAFDGEKLKVILGHQFEGKKGEEDKKAEKKESKDPVKTFLLKILQQKYGMREEDLITAEIEVVPAGPARYVGLDASMVGAYGQDDRICVFTALEALLSSNNDGRTKAIVIWDKEEIGSDGATGASSRFLEYMVEDLVRAWEPKTSVNHVMLATEALSADVTAAIDPDYQDVHEKNNAARLGFGPSFSKYTGSRGKYGANDADCEYFECVRSLLDAHNVPWQAAELGKVDGGGGGTVALFLAAWGMQVIDLGPALLSMHSPFEIASCVDVYSTWAAYKAFLNR